MIFGGLMTGTQFIALLMVVAGGILWVVRIPLKPPSEAKPALRQAALPVRQSSRPADRARTGSKGIHSIQRPGRRSRGGGGFACDAPRSANVCSNATVAR